MLSIGGLVLAASLSLEFLQMATFALQNNPYTDGGMPSEHITSYGSGGSVSNTTAYYTDVDFWGADVFEVMYVTVNDNIQYIIMWCCVSLVLFLILLFCTQFFLELRKYGYLMRHRHKKDEAKDHFFYSFTGSIVYGHGNPNNLSSTFRLVVAVLTDGLFLVISLRLLDALACDYKADTPVLLADPSIVCWEGRHSLLAYMSMTSYAFYGKYVYMIYSLYICLKSHSNLNTFYVTVIIIIVIIICSFNSSFVNYDCSDASGKSAIE